MLVLEPEVIEERLTNEEVAERRAAALPGALAAVFDLVSRVLAHLPHITVANPTRMADFMRILAALDAATGWSTLTDYRAKVAAVGVRLIEGNGLARALYYLAGPNPCDEPAWEGTAGELIAALGQIAALKDLPVKDIPTDYRVVGRKIQEIRWRSRARSDGSGVEVVDGYDLYATTFLYYDGFGNLTNVTDPKGNYTLKQYDSIGQLTSEIAYGSDGVPLSTNQFGYEPGGLVSTNINPVGGVTTKKYTSTGKPSLQTNPDGSTNAWRYYPDGRVQKEAALVSPWTPRPPALSLCPSPP